MKNLSNPPNVIFWQNFINYIVLTNVKQFAKTSEDPTRYVESLLEGYTVLIKKEINDVILDSMNKDFVQENADEIKEKYTNELQRLIKYMNYMWDIPDDNPNRG
jgi:hypothetical protein